MMEIITTKIEALDEPWYWMSHPPFEERIQYAREHLKPSMAIYRQGLAAVQGGDQEQ